MNSRFDDSYEIVGIEKQINENTLIQLMTKGFLEPAIFTEQKTELDQKAKELKKKKKDCTN